MTGLGDILLVARRELVERGRSAYFVVSTLVMLLVIGLLVALPAIMHDDAPAQIGVVEGASPALVDALGAVAEPAVEVVPVADVEAGETALAAGELAVLITPTGDGGLELVWESEPSPLLGSVIVGVLSSVEVGARAQALGIPAEHATQLVAPPTVEQRSLEPVDADHEGRFFVAMIALVLLFMAIVTYGQFVLAGVAEEKGSRVVEVLLARTAPRHLLAGKIAGIGALGLLQLVVLAGAALVTLRLVPELPGPVPDVSIGLVVWLIVWFVLGFAFYATAYGAVGALASRVEDAQNAAGPLVFVLMGVYFFVFLVAIDDPGSTLSVVGSLVPVTAPFVMPVRMTMGAVDLWQSVAAVVVMTGSIYALVRAAGRIYEGAILRTGARVRVRDAWRTAA